jgi:hypothetical protein
VKLLLKSWKHKFPHNQILPELIQAVLPSNFGMRVCHYGLVM